MNLHNNIANILATIPDHVKLIAVSKTFDAETIRKAYDCGLRRFGENKVQELAVKQPLLPDDIEWHMIGHLQTNKIKQVISLAALIHSVDSYRLLTEINKQAAKLQRIVPCLLQIHIASEENKFGFSNDELFTMLDDPGFKNLNFIRIDGLMGMASFTPDHTIIRSEFNHLSELFKQLKRTIFNNNLHFNELSMGMSGDYRIAIEAGSTMVRIGSMIFGSRT